MIICTDQQLVATNFELIKERNGSLICVDFENEVIKIEWNGRVHLETAREILNKGSDLIESGYGNRILLNRQNLDDFSTEARMWIKQDLLMKRASRLVSKVERVATVNSLSTMGNIFANFITTGIQVAFPNLKLSKFDSEEAAIDWLV